FGAGEVRRLGEFASDLGGRKVLLVTDGGLKAAGHEDRAVSLLRSSGLQVHVFDDVRPNPTDLDVEQGLVFARAANVDLIVGLGGGSSMDCAKGINFLLTNGGKMQDYKGLGQASRPMLPMIAIPTTAGTGSEAQSYAVIADAQTHMKMACGDKKALARIAILDPELTVTQPASVTAATGIDAISHAVETYVTTRRNPVSQLFSRQAWQLLVRAFPVVVSEPGNLEARGAMLLGAHLAGTAIENSMLGATHALANPLSAHFGTVHGVAIGVLLPHVVRYNSQAVARMYGDLAADAGLTDARDPEAAMQLAEHLTWLVERCGQPTTLQPILTDRALIPQLAEEAAAQWTGTFNPRPVDAPSLEELYQCALNGRAN
ncbi:MAG: iron-containing alcohol dehydrogenase, partial [Planctomycetaceae bacterium]|nr:iron-containing alcohol dehydrogenase [Planctomycetaceae bacterium]